LGSHLESGLRSLLFVEEQLWDAKGLHAVDILNVVKPFAQSYVAVDALAHAERQRPVFALEEDHWDMCQTIVHIVFRRQPRDNRLIVCQQTHGTF